MLLAVIKQNFALFSRIYATSISSKSLLHPLTKVQCRNMRYLNQQEAISVDEELFNEYKFSVDQLMELAGLSCAHAIADAYPPNSLRTNKVLICCGPGNNGGDGLVAARHLSLMSYDPFVYYPKRTDKTDLFKNLQHQAERMGITVTADCPVAARVEAEYGLIVDALFGFSFKPPVRDAFKPIMELLHGTKLPIVSVDIPSGWDVEQGPQSDCDIKPDCLISLTAPKLCAKHLSNASKHYLGGRFVPAKLEEKYSMALPQYNGRDLFVRLN
ncbi:NAD(P)H-hydrate epimerase-like isoform X2 [Anopheles stephensi]|uniref:NAD(P)H-hydrate epimerase n=1 Tax=Anopheles stephensi TaxID=30069 RepID=A0A182XXJ0_ANOST|nr:NAD(P)H-hydrate epimerase-like isoform X2 [Anopheles stephensi]